MIHPFPYELSNKDIDIELRPNGVLWNYLLSVAQEPSTVAEIPVPHSISCDNVTTVNDKVSADIDIKTNNATIHENINNIQNITLFTCRPPYISPMIEMMPQQQP